MRLSHLCPPPVPSRVTAHDGRAEDDDDHQGPEHLRAAADDDGGGHVEDASPAELGSRVRAVGSAKR